MPATGGTFGLDFFFTSTQFSSFGTTHSGSVITCHKERIEERERHG